jgi:energy-coupling factor transporter ATP-binding protein EcfA2
MMDMLNVKQMLLIGSTGQNAGKTTLAKALIHVWKDRFPIIALKITSVAHQGALCPRGGQGCGACVNITADFVLEEEHGESPSKDTAQLLHAGADRVFWLRSLYTALKQGYLQFSEYIPPNALILCESNSLREFVLPGCFIMLINSQNPTIKPSAERVMQYADLILQNNGKLEAINQIIAHIHPEQDKTGRMQVCFTK